jgi:AraC family transcriptional regulator
VFSAIKLGVVSLIYMKGAKENSGIYIKNMVCNRCIEAVRHILDEVKVKYDFVSLGEVSLKEVPSLKQTELLKTKLSEAGFLLLDDDKSKTIEKIKTIIIELVHYNNTDTKYNLSAVLSAQLHKDYSSLSRLFSEIEGVTIEKYAINQKIEKIKELLVYNEMNLNEIAFQLGYSSVAHLSAQFKKVTGLTPSFFKNSRGIARKTLDNV